MMRFALCCRGWLARGWLAVPLLALAGVAYAQGAGATPQAQPSYGMLVIGAVVGLLFRTFVPFLREKLQQGTKWKWEYILPPIAGAVISAPAVLMGLPALMKEARGGLPDFIAAFTLAYTIQDVVREAQKVGAKGR